MADHPLVIISGKGGVGKSAVSAALALASHRSGRRVLAVGMTGDGSGLSSHLGSPPLGFAPEEVRPDLFAMVLDRSKALIEYLHLQLGIPALALFGPVAKAFDALASTAPGVREIVSMGKVLHEVRKGEWDQVIVDAPPIGQIGSYLRAARTITELVPAGRIRDQAGWMGELLSDRTQVILVSVPEELPISETKEALAWINAEDLVSEIEVISNRVLPILETDRDDLPTGSAGDAARLHLQIQDEQARWLAELPTVLQLPFLFGVVTPGEVAARLSEVLEE